MNEPFSFDPQTPLQKGKACLNCRRRKTKCDAAKPICGPCSRFPASLGDCEYPTVDGRPRAKLYEDQISQYEARIAELEEQNRVSPPRVSAAEISRRSSPKLASGVLNELVDRFLEDANCFGFFLDIPNFRASAIARDLPPALSDVVNLWGIHLSQDPHITAHEPAFLEAAQRSATTQDPPVPDSLQLLHRIQASVLLAYYFLHNARFMEGGYHRSVAVALAVGGGLHSIRAQRPRPGYLYSAPLEQANEESQRIAAFWSVMNLDNCWSSAGGGAHLSSWPSGLRIYTPWPWSSESHAEPHMQLDTPERFLAGLPDGATSCAALHAKAGVLFARTGRLVTQYSACPDLRIEAELTALDACVDAFKAALPPVQSKAMMLVHTLAYACTIQLHTTSNLELRSLWGGQNKALAAARSVVTILANVDIPRIGEIDPVFAILWSSTCLVFLRELARANVHDSAHRTSCIADALKVVIATMQMFAPGSRLMSTRLKDVRRIYDETMTSAGI